jgi:hypothetical protein
MGVKLKIKNKKIAQKPGKPAAPTDPQAAIKAVARGTDGIFGNLRSRMGAKPPSVNLNKPAIPQAPGKPLGLAQALPPINPPVNPASAAAAQALQSPMSPPPAKSILPIPAVPVTPAAASPIAPQLSAQAPQVVSPAASMQAQKDQMFPPAPATPAAPVPPAPMTPPVAPKPVQVTPPAGVTKSQAEIDEEKKKLQAAAGSPV